MGVKATDEAKKGSRAVEKGEKGATSGEAGKGATAEGKGVAAVDKGGKGSSSKATVKGKGPTAEGKGKKRETAEDEKDAAAEWKLKGPTAADEEEVPNPRRERLRPRSTRREGGAAVDKDQAGTAAASEVAGEKATFVFSAAAAAAPDAGNMITLVSSEGKVFKVSEDAARLSTVLADMIDNGCAGGDIPVPNATARALATVIKYCEKHADEPDPDHGGGSSSTAASDKETLAEWDRKLVDNLTTNALFDLLLASNFLDIKGLLGVASQKVADMIQSKTPAQVRTIFGIANDFTPEEEAKIRGESPWAYEDI
ncbi:hypothetical protein HU200_051999 [Digitaria exilis]|uniref:SKP1-like protein n=1 Tax=Digitaria exilis TaxID=1010633 RepID=A0A835AS88_9POAL|nr:hypothetical protein HU200_051999 [Digitaria exilis]